MGEFPMDGSEVGNLLLGLVMLEQAFDTLTKTTAESTLAKRKVQEAQFWVTQHKQILDENQGENS